MSTFYRWIPERFATAALDAGMMSHNGAAFWIFGMDHGQNYRPGLGITRGAWLLAYDVSANATHNLKTHNIITFPSAEWVGEAAHPNHNLVKENEVGAYGIGRNRQKTTGLHTTVRFATKKEVAKALGLSELEVDVKFRPGKTWPK